MQRTTSGCLSRFGRTSPIALKRLPKLLARSAALKRLLKAACLCLVVFSMSMGIVGCLKGTANGQGSVGNKFSLGAEGEHLYYYLLLTEALSEDDDSLIAESLQGLLQREPVLPMYQDGAALLLSRKNYPAALTLAQEGLKHFPEDMMLHVLLAGSYSETGAQDKATTLLQDFLAKHPESPEAMQELIRLYMNAGEREKAQHLLTKVKVNEKTPALIFFQSKLQSAAGKYSLAKSGLLKLVREYPELVEAWAELASISEKEGKKEEAIGFYRRVLNLMPDNNEVRFRIFQLLLEQNRISEALLTAKTAPDAAPFLLQTSLYLADRGQEKEAVLLIESAQEAGASDDDIAIYLSFIYAATSKDSLKALTPLQAIKKSSPMYIKVGQRRVELLLESKKFTEAHTLAVELRTENPLMSELWGLEGYTLLKLDRGEEALALLTKATAKKPQDEDLLFAYASVQDELGKKEEAMATMERIIFINKENYKALNYIGYSLAEQNKDLPRALSLVKAALEQAPDATYIIDSLAWVYYRLGQYDEAWTTIKKCFATPPQDAAIWEHYADIALAMGNQAEAIKGYEEALQLNPSNELDIRSKLNTLKK